MSTRLNIGLKTQICKNVIDDVFKIKREQVALQEHELAVAVLKAVFGEDILNVLDGSPEGFFPQGNMLHARFGDRWEGLKFAHSRRVPYGVYTRGPALFESGNELSAASFYLNDAQKELGVQTGRLTAEVYGILDSVSSIEKFVEVWPEGEKYVPTEAKKPKDKVPAIFLSELNAKIKALKKG